MINKEELQKQFMDAFKNGNVHVNKVVIGDDVKYKIEKVEKGAIVEQNNYYDSDGKLVQQENEEVDYDDESDDDSDLEDVKQGIAEILRTDDELRRKKLKESYDALLKTQNGFNSGSDWYYIYRMMAEKKTYALPDYKPFIEDLKMAGINIAKIHKSAFTEISKRIKKDRAFPHWEVKEGKQQGVMDKGIEYARVAFHIIYK